MKRQHNVIDDRNGFKVKNTECAYEWNGLLVRKKDWEPRHPQDFLRGTADNIAVLDARPDTESEFVGLCGKQVRPEDLV